MSNELTRALSNGYVLWGFLVAAFLLDWYIRVQFNIAAFSVFSLGYGGWLCGRLGAMIARNELANLGDEQ